MSSTPPILGLVLAGGLARRMGGGDKARIRVAGKPSACARRGAWRSPGAGLWPGALREDLRKALVEEDMRKIEAWTARHGVAIADWPTTPVDPFFNVNTPANAAEAERIAAQQ